MLLRLALIGGLLLSACGPRDTEVKPIERHTALPPPGLSQPGLSQPTR